MSIDIKTIIANNLAAVRQRIVDTCLRVGRNPDSVKLIAVTKYADMSWVRALLELGHRALGENRPQQLAQRAAELPGDVEWHLIGHLQRNKVDLAVRYASQVHSVDSVRLADALSKEGVKMGKCVEILLEVNLSGEDQKHGFSSDSLANEFPRLLELPQLQIKGLMTMAATGTDNESARPTFRALRQLREKLQNRYGVACEQLGISAGGVTLTHLSMGMSGDYQSAIEEGATQIRVGSAIWDGLDRLNA